MWKEDELISKQAEGRHTWAGWCKGWGWWSGRQLVPASAGSCSAPQPCGPRTCCTWRQKNISLKILRMQYSNFFPCNIKFIQYCGADPGCLSRIPDTDFCSPRIPDPGSRISDPGSKNSNKRKGWKKFVVLPFFVVTNTTQKLKTVLFLSRWRKTLGEFTKNYRTCYPKNYH